MSFSKIIVFTIAFICSSYSYAGCTSTRCTGKVSFIYINTNNIMVKMNQDMSQLNCDLAGGQYATLRSSHPFISETYKTLLAAHLSQNPKFTIRISEFSEGCNIAYITSRIGADWSEPSTGGSGNPPPGPPGEPPVCLKKPYLPQCNLE